MLEQSCVVWGSSLTCEHKEDLERTQKYFAKLVLRDRYTHYESALIELNLESLEERRCKLMLSFAKSGIVNGKLHEFFIPRNTAHQMTLRQSDKYQTTMAQTERFKKSTIPHSQRLLNLEDKSNQKS